MIVDVDDEYVSGGAAEEGVTDVDTDCFWLANAVDAVDAASE